MCTSREVESGNKEALSCNHVLIQESQHGYLQRGRKILLSGRLVCTFGDRSADRLGHWIKLGGDHTQSNTSVCIVSHQNATTNLTTDIDSTVLGKWRSKGA